MQSRLLSALGCNLRVFTLLIISGADFRSNISANLSRADSSGIEKSPSLVVQVPRGTIIQVTVGGAVLNDVSNAISETVEGLYIGYVFEF